MSAPQQAGGRTRQAQLREALGESAYRQRQRALARAGGIARQAQLRTALGDADYCAYQHTLYQRAVQKHGSTKMHDVLATAREQRRCSRIANPTPAEALLHWLALEAGFTLHADLAGDFAWAQFRTDPERWCFGPTDALTEARVLGYACDLLLPAYALAIEVVGGVHTLTAERDAARTAALRDQGLRRDHLYQRAGVSGQGRPVLRRAAGGAPCHLTHWTIRSLPSPITPSSPLRLRPR